MCGAHWRQRFGSGVGQLMSSRGMGTTVGGQDGWRPIDHRHEHSSKTCQPIYWCSPRSRPCSLSLFGTCQRTGIVSTLFSDAARLRFIWALRPVSRLSAKPWAKRRRRGIVDWAQRRPLLEAQPERSCDTVQSTGTSASFNRDSCKRRVLKSLP